MLKQTISSIPDQVSTPDYRRVPFVQAELDGTIQTRFERVVATRPAYPALLGTTSYSYSALNEAANRLAHTLAAAISQGMSQCQEPVALLLGHGAESILAMLGVLKAGGIYTSLPPGEPVTRLRTRLADIGAHFLITNTEHMALAAELVESHRCIINLDEISPEAPISNPPCHTLPTAAAAISYTSGSTGAAKGIIQNHRATLHRAWRRANYHAAVTESRMALIHAYNFAETWGTLLNGGTLVFFDIQQQGGLALAQWLIAERITNLHISIDLYRQLLDSLPADAYFPELRVVEPLGRIYRQDVERSWQHLPTDALITSRFASTETGRAAIFLIDRMTPLTTNIIPAGYPLEDVEIFLIKEDGTPAAVEEIGQIYVRSQYFPSGYWRDPALTQQVYQPDPTRPGWQICCTGDWGKLRADGLLDFIGRKDARVKIRGYRVDLGEIEAALYQLPTIRSVVVVAHEQPAQEPYLIAYYVPASSAEPTTGALRSALAKTLPDFMLPAVFVALESLPLLPNGKIDRKRLPIPDSAQSWQRPALAAPYLAGRTPLEEQLVVIWQEVLGVQPIGILDPFLELGGNSLRAMQIHGRLLKQFQLDLSAQQLFDCATIDAMALLITQVRAEQLEQTDLDSLLTSIEVLPRAEVAQQIA